ncbi:MAG TPA: glycoside hydrolase family 2 TIM barrel-domain containing protein [Nocardioidaceae bacterium]|nr:glycoside hydrolase family 2 TIM barrel-domain containing protein [Nocardioidaceae bacterium]
MLLTRWGRDLDPERVLPEYPRPQLVRASCLNLNGWWDYAVTPASGPAPAGYDGRILVPFSPEAPLSGVGRQLRPDERLTYRRRLELPDGFAPAGGRVLLHFGAVDQTCVVHLNGTEVGRNGGGYVPFTCDLTDTLGPGPNELVVDVRDRSDGHQHASGKQRLRRGGIWYTAQSGIWQTVWAEAVPDPYVERLTLVPLLEQGMVEVTVHAGRSARGRPEARVTVAGRSVMTAVGTPVRVRVDDVRPWSPDDPHLYDVEVRLGEDRVTSYVGLRSYGVGTDARGTPRLLLNGEPVVQVGVLDQGYWPDGLLTAPADEAMVHDIETMRRLGFTMLRKHVKVEPLRWYHHCDRLGMLVWQDFVNGGGRYRTAAVTWPGRYPVRLDDTRRRSLLGRGSAPGRALFREEARRTVEHLRNVPSVATWVVFNEGWGQFDARALSDEVRALDPTRVVDHASGWHDQGGGDLRSRHDYGRRVRTPRRRDPRPFVLSEYGGRGRRVAGHTYDSGSGFGYGDLLDAEALSRWFTALHADLAAAVRGGLSATVYTQLCDVEDELNGLLTYDREVLKLDESVVRAALLRLRLAADPLTGPAAGT